jgi:hypothetical protein
MTLIVSPMFGRRGHMMRALASEASVQRGEAI